MCEAVSEGCPLVVGCALLEKPVGGERARDVIASAAAGRLLADERCQLGASRVVHVAAPR